MNKMINLLNDKVHFIIIAAAAVKCAYNLFPENDLRLFCKMLIIAFTNLGLKDFFGKMIPKLTNNQFILRKLVYRPGTTESGLPSGHCMVIFSVIPPLIGILQTYVIMLMIMYGIFIGYDRVRKEQHTYAQVIIGALVGWGMGLIMFN